MITIGIIGCGYWGPNLIRNFNALSGVRIKTICDLDQTKLGDLHRIYPRITTTTDASSLLSDRSIDAVAIATPVATHFQLAKLALKQGKHVLLEKPMTSSSDQARQLVVLAKKQNLVLMIDHTFIYSSAVQKMKQILKGRTLGKLCYFDSVRINLGLFQNDANVLWDLAPHDLSIMDFLIEKTPTKIWAHGTSHIQKGIENIVYITIEYPGNLLAHIHVNWLAPVKMRLTLISGLKKMIIYNDMEPIEKIKVYDRSIRFKKNIEDINLSHYQYRMGDMYSPRLDDIEALSLATKHFIDCITKGKQPLTDGNAGLRVVTMLEAADLSLKHGGRPEKIIL